MNEQQTFDNELLASITKEHGLKTLSKEITATELLIFFGKINAIRTEWLAYEKTQSGNNTFQKFRYFELADIMPFAQEKFKEHKIIYFFNMDLEQATLTLLDYETLLAITHTLPIAVPSMQNVMQGIGAANTYAKRYLLTQVLGIVDADLLDSQDLSKPQEKPKLSKASQKKKKEIDEILTGDKSEFNKKLEELRTLYAKAKTSGVDVETLNNIANKMQDNPNIIFVNNAIKTLEEKLNEITK